VKGLCGRFVKAPVLFLLIIMVFSLSLTLLPFYVSASDEASLAIGEADDALRFAFEAVLEAERAGVNVSDLIVKLDEAGGLLAEAEIELRGGNSSGAVSKVHTCFVMTESIIEEASSIKASALAERQEALWQTMLFSLTGSASFIVLLLIVWIRLKLRYFEKLSKMKPEVASDVEA
jgi:hypothetical protein